MKQFKPNHLRTFQAQSKGRERERERESSREHCNSLQKELICVFLVYVGMKRRDRALSLIIYFV